MINKTTYCRIWVETDRGRLCKDYLKEKFYELYLKNFIDYSVFGESRDNGHFRILMQEKTLVFKYEIQSSTSHYGLIAFKNNNQTHLQDCNDKNNVELSQFKNWGKPRIRDTPVSRSGKIQAD